MAIVILSGALQGVLYALISLGLVLIYRQSRILNFAHGSVATLSAYAALAVLGAGGPYWLAAAVAIGAGVISSVAIEVAIVRPLLNRSLFTAKIGTLGAGLILTGGLTLLFGSNQVSLPSAVGDQFGISLLGFVIGGNQVLAISTTVALTALILVMLRCTRLGLALRAVSEGPLTAQMMGVNVAVVRSVTWGLSGALAAVAALLIVPDYYLDPNFITDFMIIAFVAVVLGGFESIVGTLIGGLLFGIVSALFSYYFTERLTNTLAFVSILLVLVFLPHGLFGQSLKRVVEPIIPHRSPWRLKARWLQNANLPRRGGWLSGRSLVVAAFLASLLVPFCVSPPFVYTIAMVAAIFIAVASQNLISGYSGQLSIGQSGFMVIGAYFSVVLQTAFHWTLGPALLTSVAVAGLSGFCFGLPAIRLSGVYLAMLTMTFALAMPELAAFPGDLTGAGTGIEVPRPVLAGVSFAGTERIYYFTIAISWAVLAGIFALASSPVGRFWIAVRDSETAAASIGIDVTRRKLEVFTLGAALAGLSGALTSILIGFLSPDNNTLWTGVFLLLAVIVGGVASTLGSLLGAAFIVGMPVMLAGLPEIPQFAYGVVVLVFLFIAPDGLAAFARPFVRLQRREAPQGIAARDSKRVDAAPFPAGEA